ncbi:hypothetical protein D3C71_1586130 [compost metagenome]
MKFPEGPSRISSIVSVVAASMLLRNQSACGMQMSPATRMVAISLRSNRRRRRSGSGRIARIAAIGTTTKLYFEITPMPIANPVSAYRQSVGCFSAPMKP